MSNAIHFGNSREILYSPHVAKVLLFALFIILFLCAAKDAVAAPIITSAKTASGTVGSPFSYQITTKNHPPYAYGATGLPAGLTVNTGTGLISGTPTVAGTSTVTLSATNHYGTGHATLTITITGGEVSLSPASLAFASEPLGNAAAPQSITVANGTGTTLSITNVAITGASINDFTQRNTCGGSVAAGSNCTISVTFSPTASGARTANVTVTDNAAGSPQSVSLTGTGTTQPDANFSPARLVFGGEPLGNSTPPQGITLTNGGSAALSISSIAITGVNINDFAQTNNCGSSVAAGTYCSITVTFKPTATGTRTASVTLTDNATGSPQTVSLMGTGGGTGAAAVSLSASNLNFGNEPVDLISSSQVITLNNTGNAALSITSIAFTGANATDFTQVSTCGATVAAGGTCTIAILFTPLASGARAASLTITDTASGSPQSVSLSGAGTHDVVLTWTASGTSGVAGYNVYRGTISGGESSTPLNSTPISGTSYTDENVTAGALYYYVITAVASNNSTQSADSAETSAHVPSP
jgi:hypothetical protein